MNEHSIECCLEEQPFAEFQDLVEVLYETFKHIPEKDGQQIFDSSVFYVQEPGSWHISRQILAGRSLIILDRADMIAEQDAIVTVAHECAHAFLKHSANWNLSFADSLRQEDEAWAQVRSWLPTEFHSCIDRLERDGGGSKGIHS